MKSAPTQNRQSRCMRRQYGPGSGSPLALLFPSGLCLFPVICPPFLCASSCGERTDCGVVWPANPEQSSIKTYAIANARFEGSRATCPRSSYFGTGGFEGWAGLPESVEDAAPADAGLSGGISVPGGKIRIFIDPPSSFEFVSGCLPNPNVFN
jgi:hypothetical protein